MRTRREDLSFGGSCERALNKICAIPRAPHFADAWLEPADGSIGSGIETAKL
jgi:hypothetical protein